MGLTQGVIVKLLSRGGVNGKTLAMMGKQDIDIDMNSFMCTIRDLGYPYDKELAKKIKSKGTVDSFDFFRMLGFSEVHAVDYSSYEGADILFDLNEDIPDDLKEKFDYIINGGTLEHIFDIAKAMRNMSAMLKKGGVILHIAPVVGWVDHGFYNINPTFFKDYYSKSFQVELLELEFFLDKGDGVIRTFWSENLYLFNSESELQDYIRVMQNIEGAGRVCVVCFARKIYNGNFDTYPMQGYYRKLYGDNNQEIISVEKIDIHKFAEDIRDSHYNRKAIYGGGHVCDLVLDELFRIGAEDKVSIIFDGNVRRAGTTYRGYKVSYPTSEKIKLFDCIYIGSVDYEEEIEQEIHLMNILNTTIVKPSGYLRDKNKDMTV